MAPEISERLKKLAEEIGKIEDIVKIGQLAEGLIAELKKEVELAQKEGDLKKAKELDEELSSFEVFAKGRIAQISLQRNDIETAVSYHMKAIQAIKDLVNRLLEIYRDPKEATSRDAFSDEVDGRFNSLLGRKTSSMKFYEDAIKLYESAADKYSKIGEFEDVGDCFFESARLFMFLGDLEREAEYVEKGAKAYEMQAEKAEEAKEKTMLRGTAYFNRAIHSFRRGDFYLLRLLFKEAESAFKISTENFEQAEKYFLAAQEIEEENEANVLRKISQAHAHYAKGITCLPDFHSTVRELETGNDILKQTRKEYIKDIELRKLVEWMQFAMEAERDTVLAIELFRRGAFKESKQKIDIVVDCLLKGGQKAPEPELKTITDMGAKLIESVGHAIMGEYAIQMDRYQEAKSEFENAIKVSEEASNFYEKLSPPMKQQLLPRSVMALNLGRHWKVYISIIETEHSAYKLGDEEVFKAIEDTRILYANSFFSVPTPAGSDCPWTVHAKEFIRKTRGAERVTFVFPFLTVLFALISVVNFYSGNSSIGLGALGPALSSLLFTIGFFRRLGGKKWAKKETNH